MARVFWMLEMNGRYLTIGWSNTCCLFLYCFYVFSSEGFCTYITEMVLSHLGVQRLLKRYIKKDCFSYKPLKLLAICQSANAGLSFYSSPRFTPLGLFVHCPCT